MSWESNPPATDVWGTAPAVASSEWNSGGDNAAAGGEWGPDATGGDNANNVSKHEDGEPTDDKCRNCKAEGHFARECPEPKQVGACFNCGQEGHNKSDCPNPRVFTGECRVCHQTGHPAAECPDRPADVCKNCQQEGHKTFGCKNKRVFDHSKVPVVDPEESWTKLIAACNERDMDDARDAIGCYTKALPETTLVQLEKAFRAGGLKIHIIATVAGIPKSWVLIDLQGNLDKEYKASYHWSAEPRHKSEVDGWPADAEENLTRLEDAGFVYDRGVSLCSICDELGHSTKHCTEERLVERVEVKCINCQAIGHRMRDCPQARVDPNACRNCKQSGHNASDCPEPRSAEGVECKKCNEIGHFARDCPTAGGRECRNCGQEGHMSKECSEPRNMNNVTCRNCEKTGHFSKECPLPTDWSKVKCSNCEEMGHTYKRCKQPPKQDTLGGGGDAGADAAWGAFNADATESKDNGPVAETSGGW